MWRKESVTIMERAEDVDEESDDVTDNPNAGVPSTKANPPETKVTVSEPKTAEQQQQAHGIMAVYKSNSPPAAENAMAVVCQF